MTRREDGVMNQKARLMIAILAGLCLLAMMACAGAGNNLSGPRNQADEAKIDAAALDAYKWCPDEWRAAEMMMRHAEKLMQSQQFDLARATMQEALRLYRLATECAAKKRRERSMPVPIPVR